MEGINAADILGIVFLGYGIIDGYRKGFVKKGILFGISILTLVLVYMASPYVAEFSGGYFRSVFSGECAGNGQRYLQTARLKRIWRRGGKIYVCDGVQSSFGGSYLSDSKTPPEDSDLFFGICEQGSRNQFSEPYCRSSFWTASAAAGTLASDAGGGSVQYDTVGKPDL